MLMNASSFQSHAALPQDWPCWRGPNGDGKSGVTGIRKDWKNGLKKVWEVSKLCAGPHCATWSAPSIQGKYLVVPGRSKTHDLVFCYNADTGEQLWKTSFKVSTSTRYGRGPRATPAINDGRVYTLGRKGDLICWALKDGEEIWRVNLHTTGKPLVNGDCSSPLIIDNLVYVQAGTDAKIIAFDKVTGEEKWRRPGKAGYSSLIKAKVNGMDQILTFGMYGISGVDLNTGKGIWHSKWQTPHGMNASTPVTDGQIVFVTSAYKMGCMAVQVDGEKTTTLWRSKVLAGMHTDPILIDGYVYGYSGGLRDKGSLKCIELKTGKEIWSSEEEVGHGTIVHVDGHFICLTYQGDIFLVKADPKEFVKVGEHRGVFDKRNVWTVPVVANGKLYVRYCERLVCFDLKRPPG